MYDYLFIFNLGLSKEQSMRVSQYFKQLYVKLTIWIHQDKKWEDYVYYYLDTYFFEEAALKCNAFILDPGFIWRSP